MRTRNFSVNATVSMALSSLLLIAGCETSDTALREAGHGEAYVQGFHDGRHSGMKQAGNYLEHMVKDQERFSSDAEYRRGWQDGEAEGERIQQQADAAVGGYGSYKSGRQIEQSKPNYDAVGRDALKGVDTESLKTLGK